MEYELPCAKCASLIKTVTKPITNIFLCNSCHLSWKEIRDKMIGHSYIDEVQKSFIKWINTAPQRRT